MARIHRRTIQKRLHDPDNHNGVITHLETDILECQVKGALGSITMNKISGGDRIPVELLQVLKDDAVKVLHSICPQIWKTQQWPQDWKRSVFIAMSKKGNAKDCSNYCTVALISYDSKVILKILQASFSNTWSVNFQMFKLVLKKEPEIKLPTSLDHGKSKRVPEKYLFLLYWLCQSLWLCGPQQIVENTSGNVNIRPPHLPPEKSVC